MEEAALLNNEEKFRIRMEEMFRHECRQNLESKDKKSSAGKAWSFLNSTLGIWFLSTCVVGLITFLYTEQQEKERAETERKQNEIEHARRNASMVTVLLPYLASDEEKEWRIAIKVTEYLKLNGELPGELESALAGIVVPRADSIKSSQGQQAKINAAAAVIDLQAVTQAQKNNTGVGSLPARVYIQIANEEQRSIAKNLQASLRAENFLAPGVENVGGKARTPNEIEVRYYRDEEKEEAVRLINLLKKIDLDAAVKSTPQKIPGTGRGTRPRHYEIWFPKL